MIRRTSSLSAAAAVLALAAAAVLPGSASAQAGVQRPARPAPHLITFGSKPGLPSVRVVGIGGTIVSSAVGRAIDLKLRGTAYKVTVFRTGPARFRVGVADPSGHTTTVVADVERVGPYASRIRVGGRSHRLVTAAHGPVQLVEVDGVTHRVSRDEGGVLRWNSFLIACRETAELRAEDRHLGAALLRVLAEMELTTALFSVNAAKSVVGVSHATAFAFACARWSIEPAAALQTFAWAWVENQVLAAVKLVPLGQSAAQRMLHRLTARIPPLVEQAHKLTDSDIGISTALSAVASGRHEIQYSRLFRS